MEKTLNQLKKEYFSYIMRAIKTLRFKQDFSILKHYRHHYRYVLKQKI